MINHLKLKASKINFDIIKMGEIPFIKKLKDKGLENYLYKSLLEASGLVHYFLIENMIIKMMGGEKDKKEILHII